MKPQNYIIMSLKCISKCLFLPIQHVDEKIRYDDEKFPPHQIVITQQLKVACFRIIFVEFKNLMKCPIT